MCIHVRGSPLIPPAKWVSPGIWNSLKRVNYLKQQEFNGTHVSSRAGCLQGRTPLKTFPGFLYLYNLHFIRYGPISSGHIEVIFLQISCSLSWGRLVSVTSQGRFSSGAILGQHIPPSPSLPPRPLHSVARCD